jgi:hypothetical protein
MRFTSTLGFPTFIRASLHSSLFTIWSQFVYRFERAKIPAWPAEAIEKWGFFARLYFPGAPAMKRRLHIAQAAFRDLGG